MLGHLILGQLLLTLLILILRDLILEYNSASKNLYSGQVGFLWNFRCLWYKRRVAENSAGICLDMVKLGLRFWLEKSSWSTKRKLIISSKLWPTKTPAHRILVCYYCTTLYSRKKNAAKKKPCKDFCDNPDTSLWVILRCKGIKDICCCWLFLSWR